MVPALELTLPERGCDACGTAALVPFSDLGEVPVDVGQHWPSEGEALASPRGKVVLGYCPECAYVRNLAFDESLIDPDAPTDMNLYHSRTFREFSSALVRQLAQEWGASAPLGGKRVVEIGCAQGEFLRELCQVAGCYGVGYDPSFAGLVDTAPAVELHRAPAPVAGGLPPFDLLVSRFVLEHVVDPAGFLRALREQAGDHVRAHLQVPDAAFDFATAGWEVIYPHVSYFGATALCRIARRVGWRVDRTDPLFAGLIRRLDLSVAGTGPEVPEPDLVAARDELLTALAGFDQRHHAERRRWQETIVRLAAEGSRPVLWGAGSRGVQLLNYADPQRRLSAVVDVNPAKWGRHLPGTGHRVDEPEQLRAIGPRAVIITNPVYRDEIARSLSEWGVPAEILSA